MADFDQDITDFYAGDSLTIAPDIPVIDPAAIVGAFFMVKSRADDDDGAAVLTKAIGRSAGADGILTSNTGAGTVNTRFDLANAETLLLSPATNPAAFAGLYDAPILWEILLQSATPNDYRAQGTIKAKGARRIKDH